MAIRVSQIVAELLIPFTIEVPVLPVYPDRTILPGLGFSLKWTQSHFNMPTQTTSSGADIDLGLADTPLDDFELTYNFLRQIVAGSQEFKILFGFFRVLGGTRGRFAFSNVDDNAVVGQAVATTDGVSRNYGPIVRTFGAGGFTVTEAVGIVDTGSTVNVYLNGTLQTPVTDYNLDTSEPLNQRIVFVSTPAAALPITIDCKYFYYCKFPSNAATFEKFMNELWLLGKITLHSCRPGA